MTTETTTTKVSLKQRADELKAAQATTEAAYALKREAEKHLDALPKTPTGKDTKVVKEAKAKAKAAYEAKVAESNQAHTAFMREIRVTIRDFCKARANFANVDFALSKQGFRYEPELTQKLRAAHAQRTQSSEANPKPKQPFASLNFDEHSYVFKHENGTHAAVRIENVAAVFYVGNEPKSDTFGLGLSTDESCITWYSYHEQTNGTINLSSIGSEHHTTCRRRLQQVITLLDIQHELAIRCPYIRPSDLYDVESHYADAASVADILHVVRRTCKGSFDQHYDVTLLVHKADVREDDITLGHIFTDIDA